MARPKSYNRQDAITRACMAFWEHGYTALGVRALEAQTGLNKFAIRTEFGGKEGLYLAALNHYHTAAKDTVLAPLKTGGIPAIAQFFRGLVTLGTVNSSAWGCLMVNTGIENAEINSAALQQASDAYWTDLQDHFCMALTNARTKGQIAPTRDIDDAARGLVSAVMGIHTANRVGKSHEAGRYLVVLVLDLLKTWEVADAD